MEGKTDQRRCRTAALIAATLITLLAPLPAAIADDKHSDGDWTMGGQDLRNWRNQSETRISPHNVDKLKSKWTFTTNADVSATPSVADGVVYFPDFAGYFYAVNAKTGSLLWSRHVSNWTGIVNDYSRNSPAIHHNMLILGDQAGTLSVWNGSQLTGAGARVMAVNAKTGDLIWVTQVDAFPTAMITSSPVVHDGIVVVGIAQFEEATAANGTYPCCVARGSVVGLDVRTGRKLWQTHTVPDNGGVPGGYSGGAVWAVTPVIDTRRNSVYVGTGNNYSVPDAAKACIKATPANKNCTDHANNFDSVLALDLRTGRIKWARRGLTFDAWNVACLYVPEGAGNCPMPEGPDYDFGGSGPNLLTANGRDIVGIGSKSGIYWALDPDNGHVVWNTQVGPGSELGGIEWGTATDGKRIYVPIANWRNVPHKLQPSGVTASTGSWAALDPENGKILWQTAKPLEKCLQGCMALGPTSVANGVVFAASMDPNPANPTMYALDAHTGKLLWSFAAGSSVVAAPAIVGNSVYWGAGFSRFALGTPNNKLYAFTLDHDAD